MTTKYYSIILLISVSIVLFSLTIPTTAPVEETMYVNNEVGLKLLKQPNKDGQLVEIITFGTKIMLAEAQKDGYIQVKTATNTGFVPSQFLQTTQPKPTALSKIFHPSNHNNYINSFSEEPKYINTEYDPFGGCDSNEMEETETSIEHEWFGNFLTHLHFTSSFTCPNSLMAEASIQKNMEKTIVIDNDIIEITPSSIRLNRYNKNLHPLNPTPNTRWVLKEMVNVYEKANVNSKKLGVLQRREQVSVSSKEQQASIIHNDIKGSFIAIETNELKGYVFDGYLSSIPLPQERIKWVSDYLKFLDKAGYSTIESGYSCNMGDCETISSAVPVASGYHAFCILKILKSDNRLKSIKYDKTIDRYLVSLTPRTGRSYEERGFENVEMTELAIHQEGEESGTHVTVKDGFLFIESTPGDW